MATAITAHDKPVAVHCTQTPIPAPRHPHHISNVYGIETITATNDIHFLALTQCLLDELYPNRVKRVTAHLSPGTFQPDGVYVGVVGARLGVSFGFKKDPCPSSYREPKPLGGLAEQQPAAPRDLLDRARAGHPKRTKLCPPSGSSDAGAWNGNTSSSHRSRTLWQKGEQSLPLKLFQIITLDLWPSWPRYP